MKRLLVLAAVAAVAFCPVVAQADSVTADETVNVGGGFSLSGGQPFKITESEGNVFDSFCVELDESITPGGNYVVQAVSSRAYEGGVGGQEAPGGDPVSMQTAWLYRNFRNNHATLIANPFAVQQAIWNFETEGNACAGDCATFQTLANANATALDLNYVRVINFGPIPGVTGGLVGDPVQDLLTLVPEPASMLLLGLGLVGAAGAARRRSSK